VENPGRDDGAKSIDCGRDEGAGRAEFVRVGRVVVVPARGRVDGSRDAPSIVDCVRAWPAGLRVDGKRLRPVTERVSGLTVGSEGCDSSERVLIGRVALFVPARGRLCARVRDSMPMTLIGLGREASAVGIRRCAALTRDPLGSNKLCLLFDFVPSICAILGDPKTYMTV